MHVQLCDYLPTFVHLIEAINRDKWRTNQRISSSLVRWPNKLMLNKVLLTFE